MCMLEKYKDSQSIFYNYFMNSFNSNRISHAYLIETNNVSYGFSLAVDLAKFLFCNGVFDSKICDLIDSGNYPDLKIIGSDVKKSEIALLKSSFSRKSFDDNRQIYIISDAALMNKASSNSLLKFLEEPDGDIIAILLCNNVNNVLSTISSRCQIISLINDSDVFSDIFVSLFDSSESDLDFNSFCFEYSDKFYEFYKLFEESGSLVLAEDIVASLSLCVKEFLTFGLYLYFDALNLLLDRDCRYLPDVYDLKFIVCNNSIDDIIKKVDVIKKFLYDLRFNVNVNLFLDNFVISLEDR